MTVYEANMRKQEDELIKTNRGAIEAFLMILENRAIKSYYWCTDESKREALQKKVTAIELIRKELGNITTEQTEK